MKFSTGSKYKTCDNGEDLKIGDTVYIKCIVVEKLNDYGDVKLRFLPRMFHDEHARTDVNSIFLRRRFWKCFKFWK